LAALPVGLIPLLNGDDDEGTGGYDGGHGDDHDRAEDGSEATADGGHEAAKAARPRFGGGGFSTGVAHAASRSLSSARR
jgi:hypothetical protein